MNIALISENYLFDPPGAQTLVRTQRRELERRGHTVCVITTHNPDIAHNDHQVLEVPSIRLPGGSGVSLSFPGLGHVDSIVAKSDIVQAYEPRMLGAWAAQRARHYHKPSLYVHHPHERLSGESVGIINQFDGVIAPLPSDTQALPVAGVASPIYPIVYGHVPAHASANDPHYLHRRVGAELDAPALIYAGPLTSQANVPLLVDAIVPVESPVHFFIAGDGPERQAIEHHVATRGAQQRIHVLMLGTTDRQAVYRGAALALSAGGDPHPTWLIEAAAHGVPTLAVRSPQTEQVTRNRVTGILTLPTKTSLTRAVNQLLHRPALRHRYGLAAKQHAATYSIERSVDQMLDVYAMFRRLHHVEG